MISCLFILEYYIPDLILDHFIYLLWNKYSKYVQWTNLTCSTNGTECCSSFPKWPHICRPWSFLSQYLHPWTWVPGPCAPGLGRRDSCWVFWAHCLSQFSFSTVWCDMSRRSIINFSVASFFPSFNFHLYPHYLLGVIDSCYRGPIGVILQNIGNMTYYINSMDPIAQIIIMPFLTVSPQVVTSLSPSIRGNLGGLS